MQNTDLIELLNYIDPSTLNYQEWINVGFALKQEGYNVADWDAWSMKDAVRYHAGECFRKWDSFKGAGAPITGATIVQMAKDRGWQPMRSGGRELDWNDVINKDDDLVIVDKGWIEGKEIQEPIHWDPVKELTTYLETLFISDENVGYVTRSWEKDGKHMPTKGCCDRTAGQLIQELQRCEGDIGKVLGDYNPEVGAWIRFNPLDGKGSKNENVTDWRYALVESDSMDPAQQNAIIRELELPVACLVYSGKKSIHAIVHIDAADYYEYRKRVDYLYSICKKNGLKVDQQNKNPSRLSRMPGIVRNGHKQFLIDTNIGKSSWDEWKEWIESVNDDLPNPESLEDFWDNLPDLAPPLIDGILRQGHKMLIAGPSKAGKSFALIEMCIAIAEGVKWLEWQCVQGKVMYVNLELDRASCLHRFKDVYQELGIIPKGLKNIDIWNLRGKSIPMDKLAPKLIRRAAKKNYIAIVIDPIYKIITGDENSADQMANFCNQFDKVCTELNCAVIYCHHHSKGSQGSKRSMDRASGSGVFARDPDALLDLIELEMNEDLIKQQSNRAVCDICIKWLQKYGKENLASDDDMCSEKEMLALCRFNLKSVYDEILKEIAEARSKIKRRTAWRIEGTLREYPKFEPVNLWFDYPVHKHDLTGVLKDVNPDDMQPVWKKAMAKRKDLTEKKKERRISIETAYSACNTDEKVTVKDLSEYLGVGEKTVRRYIKEHGGFSIKEGIIEQKSKGQ